MTCPNCGQANQAGYSRCGHCNIKLPPTPTPEAAGEPAVVRCWNCAQANAPDAIRCGHCNAKFQNTAVPSVPATASDRPSSLSLSTR